MLPNLFAKQCWTNKRVNTPSLIENEPAKSTQNLKNISKTRYSFLLNDVFIITLEFLLTWQDFKSIKSEGSP